MNWVVMPVRNCVNYTRESVRSLLLQTIPTRIWVLNQGSRDETPQWAWAQDKVIVTHHYPPIRALGGAWNYALRTLFRETDHILVVNNDTLFRPETYERLLAHNKPFVTAVGVDSREQFEQDAEGVGERPHPDFSCFLIRREVVRKAGWFDEHFIPCYKEDWDAHRRMEVAGIEAVCIDLPFLHYASRTIKENEEDAKLVGAWDKFRTDYYREKWGGDRYEERFTIPFNGAKHQCPICA